jgi:hypothetical protein
MKVALAVLAFLPFVAQPSVADDSKGKGAASQAAEVRAVLADRSSSRVVGNRGSDRRENVGVAPSRDGEAASILAKLRKNRDQIARWIGKHGRGKPGRCSA